MDKYKLVLRRRIGQRVKQAREGLELTQEELAELVGNGNRHVSLIENGQVNVTIDILAALAHHLAIEPADLLAPESSDAPRQPAGFVVTADALDRVEQALQTIAEIRRPRKRRSAPASKPPVSSK